MPDQNFHLARQAAVPNILTDEVVGEVLFLKKCNQSFQLIARPGFSPPACLTDQEADHFVRLSSQYFTIQNTEARVNAQLGDTIPKINRSTKHPDLDRIAKKTAAMLYTKTGEEFQASDWNMFTDGIPRMGLALAKSVNKWAAEKKVSEEERCYYLIELELVENHAELWSLPPDHPRHPQKLDWHAVKPKQSVTTRDLIKPSKKEEADANIDTHAMPSFSVKPLPDVPIAGPTWDPNERRVVDMDALCDTLVMDGNDYLTVRELAHAVRATLNPQTRYQTLSQMATMFKEMAEGYYKEP